MELEAKCTSGGRPDLRASFAADAADIAGREAPEPLSMQVQRMWAIAAAAKIVHERGVEEVDLDAVSRRAGIRDSTLARMFPGRIDLLAGAYRTAWTLAGERAIPVYAAEMGAVQRIRMGVAQLLAFREAEPELSSVALSDAAELAQQRGRLLRLLARIVADELDACLPRPARHGEVEAAVAQAVGIAATAPAGARSSSSSRTVLETILGVLLTPHLGEAAARIEAALPAGEAVLSPPSCPAPDSRVSLDVRLTAHMLSRRREGRGGI